MGNFLEFYEGRKEQNEWESGCESRLQGVDCDLQINKTGSKAGCMNNIDEALKLLRDPVAIDDSFQCFSRGAFRAENNEKSSVLQEDRRWSVVRGLFCNMPKVSSGTKSLCLKGFY